MDTALLWGAVGSLSLLLGAGLAFARTWSPRLIGMVLAFGAGALISSVSFELFEEGVHTAGALPVGIGLALGAITFFLGNRFLEQRARTSVSADSGGSAGPALALGALLDGIPEQAVLGIGIADGTGVSLALVIAIFVSNLPEAIGSSADMLEEGRTRSFVLRVWIPVAVICTLATVAGYAIANDVAGAPRAAINGFAAGALLVMLVDSMIPEAHSKARNTAGLATVVGFAAAAALSLAG